jgi:hypothetical protein
VVAFCDTTAGIGLADPRDSGTGMGAYSGGVSVPSDGVTAPGAVVPHLAVEVTMAGRTAPVRWWWSSGIALFLVSLGGGLAAGGGWALLAPVVARWNGAGEETAAQDVTFGLIGVAAGLVTAVLLMIRPGSRPALRVALVLAATTCASLLAWGFGVLFGAQPLQAIALVVLWPLVAAAATVVRSLIVVLVGPGDDSASKAPCLST